MSDSKPEAPASHNEPWHGIHDSEGPSLMHLGHTHEVPASREGTTERKSWRKRAPNVRPDESKVVMGIGHFWQILDPWGECVALCWSEREADRVIAALALEADLARERGKAQAATGLYEAASVVVKRFAPDGNVSTIMVINQLRRAIAHYQKAVRG